MSIKPLQQRVQNEAYYIVLLQLLGVALIALIAIPITGAKSALSILLGGCAYVVPNIFFVWRVFRYVGAHQVAQFMTAFFIGEMLKLILSAILFLVIVNYLPVSLLSVLIGYVSAIIAFWIACMYHFSKKSVMKQSH